MVEDVIVGERAAKPVWAVFVGSTAELAAEGTGARSVLHADDLRVANA
jgi:hypothetical protein